MKPLRASLVNRRVFRATGANPTAGPSLRARRAARLGAGLLSAVAAYQVALAAGLPLGDAVLGGRASTVDGVLTPGFRVIALGQAIVLVGFARVFLARAGLLTLQRMSTRTVPGAMWLVNGFLALNTAGNLVSPHPVERWGMAGTTMAILGSGLVVASSARAVPSAHLHAVPA